MSASSTDKRRARRKAAELVGLLAGGRIRPIIGERYSPERGGEAIERMKSRSALGKMVIMS